MASPPPPPLKDTRANPGWQELNQILITVPEALDNDVDVLHEVWVLELLMHTPLQALLAVMTSTSSGHHPIHEVQPFCGWLILPTPKLRGQ